MKAWKGFADLRLDLSQSNVELNKNLLFSRGEQHSNYLDIDINVQNRSRMKIKAHNKRNKSVEGRWMSAGDAGN